MQILPSQDSGLYWRSFGVCIILSVSCDFLCAPETDSARAHTHAAASLHFGSCFEFLTNTSRPEIVSDSDFQSTANQINKYPNSGFKCGVKN